MYRVDIFEYKYDTPQRPRKEYGGPFAFALNGAKPFIEQVAFSLWIAGYVLARQSLR